MTPDEYRQAMARAGNTPCLQHAVDAVNRWLDREVQRCEGHEDSDGVDYLLDLKRRLCCAWAWTNGGEKQLKLPY